MIDQSRDECRFWNLASGKVVHVGELLVILAHVADDTV